MRILDARARVGREPLVAAHTTTVSRFAALVTPV